MIERARRRPEPVVILSAVPAVIGKYDHRVRFSQHADQLTFDLWMEAIRAQEVGAIARLVPHGRGEETTFSFQITPRTPGERRRIATLGARINVALEMWNAAGLMEAASAKTIRRSLAQQ